MIDKKNDPFISDKILAQYVKEDSEGHKETFWDFLHLCKEEFVAGCKEAHHKAQMDKVTAEDRKYYRQILEQEAFYTANKGSLQDKLEVLHYFQERERMEAEADKSNPHVTAGEHLSSITFWASMTGFAILALFITSLWTCNGRNSNFCKDIQRHSPVILNYFSEN